jgi:hypothetical protein
MRAETYTTKNNEITFHYSFSDLRNFIIKGRNTLDMEFVLVKVVDDMKHYKGYVRQYNDVVIKMKLIEQMDPFYDGRFNPEHLLKSYTMKPSTTPYKFEIMYIGDKNNKSIN